MCAGLNLGNAWLFSLSPGELIMEFDGSSGKAESWGQACDLCDLEFDRVRVAAGALPERRRLRITQIAGLTPSFFIIGTIENHTNRRLDPDLDCIRVSVKRAAR